MSYISPSPLYHNCILEDGFTLSPLPVSTGLMAAAFIGRQVKSCVPCLKVWSSLIALSLCQGGSPLSCGSCWDELFSQGFSLKLTGEKLKLKRVRES